MDKFKLGDDLYWVGSTAEGNFLDDVIIGQVIEYRPEGIGWLKWVKYRVAFSSPKGTFSFCLGNKGSPDVFGSKVMTKEEYEFALGKREYEELLDHGNGD